MLKQCLVIISQKICSCSVVEVQEVGKQLQEVPANTFKVRVAVKFEVRLYMGQEKFFTLGSFWS